jgi:TRAP-type uncharacterized transport system fused permease subunit
LYYSSLAVLTPPDALASVAAAGLAGSPFIKTALHATRVAFVAFIVPFLFVYRPALLTLGSGGEIARDVLIAVLGVAVTSVALEGYCLRRLTLVERGLAFACGIALIFPTGWADIAGLALLALLVAMQWWSWKRPVVAQSASET